MRTMTFKTNGIEYRAWDIPSGVLTLFDIDITTSDSRVEIYKGSDYQSAYLPAEKDSGVKENWYSEEAVLTIKAWLNS